MCYQHRVRKGTGSDCRRQSSPHSHGPHSKEDPGNSGLGYTYRISNVVDFFGIRL
jgi:hypothetical protein